MFIQHWEIWCALDTEYSLYDILPFSDWVVTFSRLETMFTRTPIELAVLSFSDANFLDSAHAPQMETNTPMETPTVLERTISYGRLIFAPTPTYRRSQYDFPTNGWVLRGESVF